jgi:hypothetical protein
MNLLAMTKHMGIRWEELGFLLGAVGGFLLAFGNMMPFAKRTGGMLGGIALAGGFVLAIIGVHYGRLG